MWKLVRSSAAHSGDSKGDRLASLKPKRLWLRPDGPGPAFAATLVLAAIVVPVVQAALGEQLAGWHGAHDGSFATYTLIQFQTELAQGHGLPRWSFDGNFGLGSPIFYIYPPGAFAVAAWMGELLPWLAVPTLLDIAGILFRVGAIATCALWLRRHTSPGSAITGGALYALMPYISVINPQVRLAFAETAAAALLPLVFLAVDLGAAEIVRTIVLVSVAMALLAVTHLPSTVLAGGVALLYAMSLAGGAMWCGAQQERCLASCLGSAWQEQCWFLRSGCYPRSPPPLSLPSKVCPSTISCLCTCSGMVLGCSIWRSFRRW